MRELITAFRPDWERLGEVAARLGYRNGQKLVKPAQDLRDRGLVESKLIGPCLAWRLTDDGGRKTGVQAPIPFDEMLTSGCRYDPPVELEGPHAGLTRTVAERLRNKHSKIDAPSWEDTAPEVRLFWLGLAEDTLELLLGIGFTGPAGEPDPDRFEGRNYAWLDPCHWEVLDSEGGFVALLGDSTDVELVMAAPGMMTAIHALLGAIPSGHPAREMPELQALELSLPENRENRKVEEKNDASN